MNKLLKNCHAATFSCVMAVFSMLSCVNEEYDLSKGVEMDVQLLQNTTIPLGNTGTIAINSLLGDVSSGSSFFKIDQNGDMSMDFGHEVMTQSFTMPEVTLGGEGGLMSQNITVKFSIGDTYTRFPANVIAGILASEGSDRIYCSTSGILNPGENGVDEKIAFEFDKELPESVLSIRSLDMDGNMNFVFSASAGAYMHLEKGFVIDFPSFITIDTKSKNLPYEIHDGNKVVFTEDTMLSYMNPLVLDMKFTRLAGLEEMVNEKKNSSGQTVRFITSDKKIRAYGNVYLMPKDYGDAYIPKSPDLVMDVDMSNLEMTSAEVMINMDLHIDDTVVGIGDLPEMFSGEGTVVDLYNPIIGFSINNNSPLEMNLNAEITSQTETHTTDIHIGNHCKNGNHETAPVVIPSDTEVSYYFSRQGYHNTNGGEDITLEKLGEVISDMPNVLSIHDILIESERKFITINANQEYSVDLDFDFSSSLSFGKDLHVTFDYDIDLALNTESLGLNNIVLYMNMLNTIPLNLNVLGVAVDENGNELNSSVLDITLKAGTLANPVGSPAEISLASDSEINISKLRLKITAFSDEQMQGNVLNTEQGLNINDLHIKLPDGVKIDLNNNDLE